MHELVAAFKTVKEETLFKELKVLPAGAVYIRSPSAQPLVLYVPYRDIKDQQNSWTAVQDILYVS